MAGEGPRSGKKDNSAKSGDAARRQIEKREQAEARRATYLALTLDEKLQMIEERPGNSRREKARLLANGKGQ